MTAHDRLAAVLFDFAGTLFDDRTLRDAHLLQLHWLADRCGSYVDNRALRAAYRQGLGRAYGEVATGHYYSHRDLFAAAYTATAEVLGASLDTDDARKLVDRQYFATVAHAELRPDCVDLLKVLRSRGLHLQIVSNIDIDQIDALVDKFGLDGLLDEWTSSEEVQSCKPHPAIFEAALKKAQCAPEQVLFVGDTVMHDITTPAQLGMRTALLAPNHQEGDDDGGATHVVRTLADIDTLVSS